MDLNSIADPSAQSVLDLLVREEARANGTAEATSTTAQERQAYVDQELLKLDGVLRDERWNQHTTGVHFVKLLADLVDAGGSDLHDFVNQTIDAKRNSFRPYRVSQYVQNRYGVGITNHTVQRMLGLLADAGKRGRRSVRPKAPDADGSMPRSSWPKRDKAASDETSDSSLQRRNPTACRSATARQSVRKTLNGIASRQAGAEWTGRRREMTSRDRKR